MEIVVVALAILLVGSVYLFAIIQNRHFDCAQNSKIAHSFDMFIHFNKSYIISTDSLKAHSLSI